MKYQFLVLQLACHRLIHSVGHYFPALERAVAVDMLAFGMIRLIRYVALPNICHFVFVELSVVVQLAV